MFCAQFICQLGSINSNATSDFCYFSNYLPYLPLKASRGITVAMDEPVLVPACSPTLNLLGYADA